MSNYSETYTREDHIAAVMSQGCTRAEATEAVDSIKPWTGAFIESEDGR